MKGGFSYVLLFVCFFTFSGHSCIWLVDFLLSNPIQSFDVTNTADVTSNLIQRFDVTDTPDVTSNLIQSFDVTDTPLPDINSEGERINSLSASF